MNITAINVVLKLICIKTSKNRSFKHVSNVVGITEMVTGSVFWGKLATGWRYFSSPVGGNKSPMIKQHVYAKALLTG